jgi:5-hydroxyisourate hydrolase-like protein (transthyretin family)
MFWRILSCSLLAVGVWAQGHPAQSAPAAAAQLQISGVLLDAATGQPIRQARVAIAPVTGRDTLSTIVTGEDGQFVFRNLAAGKYTLTAQRRGYLTRSFNQHDEFSSSIVVGPDLDSSNVVFRLPQECAISGRISDEAGEPVGRAQVLLYQTETADGGQGIHLRQRSFADEEGLYHFAHLPAGRYFVAVIAAPWYAQRPASQQLSYSTSSNGFSRFGLGPDTYPEEQGRSTLDVAYPITYYPGVTQESAATPIALKEGEKFVADMSLQPVQALSIHIPAGDSDTANSKTNFFQLQSRLFDASPVMVAGETRVLTSGDLEIVGIPPGHYQAEIFDNRGGDRVASKSGEVTVLASGDVNLEHETPSVAVTATVQLDAGVTLPLQGYLQLYNSKAQESAREQVSGAGEIEFKRTLRPGRYELSFNNNDGEYIKTASATGGVLSGRTLDIKGNAPLKLSVTIARGQGAINGVAFREDKPLAGAMILLVPSDPARNQVLFRRDQSDTDGTFTLPSVVPGKYTLLAIENGWDLEWMNPAVLKPYLSSGEALEVQQNGKYQVKVKVQ